MEPDDIAHFQPMIKLKKSWIHSGRHEDGKEILN
jgi:hypothetical protein